jgi:hypothetical protein
MARMGADQEDWIFSGDRAEFLRWDLRDSPPFF